MTSPSQARAASASTRVFPLPAAPVMTDTVSGDVSAQNSAAAWSMRSPDPARAPPASLARSRSASSRSSTRAPSRAAASARAICGALCACAVSTSAASRAK